MAKQIIVLDVVPESGSVLVQVAWWFPVPAGNRRPDPAATSQFTLTDPTELAALRDGSVEEVIENLRYSGRTNVQILADLAAQYQARLTARANQGFRGRFYGTFFDGTTWTAGQ